MMDPESVEKYTELAKRLNIPQGEMISFIRNAYKDEREERRLQREQDKKEKLEEEERKESQRIADEGGLTDLRLRQKNVKKD